MKTYVALDEINFPPILVYNAFGRETIVYRNIVQYFTFNQIWAFESAVEILTLFSVSPVDMPNVLGTLSYESWGRQARHHWCGSWSLECRREKAEWQWKLLLNCIVPFILRFMPQPAWVGSHEACDTSGNDTAPEGTPWLSDSSLDLRDLRWTNYYFSGIWLLEHFQNICVYKKLHTKMLKCPRRDSTIWDRVSWSLSPKSFCCEILGKGKAQWSD